MEYPNNHIPLFHYLHIFQKARCQCCALPSRLCQLHGSHAFCFLQPLYFLQTSPYSHTYHGDTREMYTGLMQAAKSQQSIILSRMIRMQHHISQRLTIRLSTNLVCALICFPCILLSLLQCYMQFSPPNIHDFTKMYVFFIFYLR